MAQSIPELEDAEIELARAARRYIRAEDSTCTPEDPEGKAGEQWQALMRAAQVFAKAKAKRDAFERKNDGNIYR